MQGNASLTAKQEQFVMALLAGSSIVDAARTCKVNESTAHRWLKLPAFQARLQAAKQEAFDESLSILQTGVRAAIATLASMMKNAESESVRLRAAQIWLDNAIALHKMSEIQTRFDELERIIKASGLAR